MAIFMGNEPAYVWLGLGLMKLGCAMACLNYNIRAKSLLHCFQCSGAKVLLASPGEPGNLGALALGSSEGEVQIGSGGVEREVDSPSSKC